MVFKDVKVSVELANLANRTSDIFDDWIEPFVDPEHSAPLRRLLDIIQEEDRAQVARLAEVLGSNARYFAKRKAEQGVSDDCEQCGGTGLLIMPGPNRDKGVTCPVCHGTKKAKLLTKPKPGKHLPDAVLFIKLPRIFANHHTKKVLRGAGEVSTASANTITFMITSGESYDDWLAEADSYRIDNFPKRVCASAKRAYKTLDTFRVAACETWGHDFKKGWCLRCEAKAPRSWIEDAATQRVSGNVTPKLPRNQKVDAPAPSGYLQHRHELPHGLGCAGCRDAGECNECGREGIQSPHDHCVNGRCNSCCATVCKHREK